MGWPFVLEFEREADGPVRPQLIPHNTATDAKYLASADVAPLDTATMKPKGDGKIYVMDALVILQRAVNLVSR